MIRTAIVDGRHRTIDTDAVELGERAHTWLLTEAQAPGLVRLLLLRIAGGWRPVGAPVLAGTTLLVATRGGGLYAFRPQ